MKRGLGLISVGLGVGLMYLLDPQMGKRRRALARDKMGHWANKASEAANVTLRDAMNRTRGLVSEMRPQGTGEEVSDEVLVERVRAQIGTLVGHPSSLDVTAAHGHVTLSGPILAHEVDRLIQQVSSIQGVSGVENRLQVHQEPGNVPGLQGQPTRRRGGGRFELLQVHWSPTARFLVGTAGSVLAVYGARRRGAMGSAIGASGLTLLARAVANREVKRLVGVTGWLGRGRAD